MMYLQVPMLILVVGSRLDARAALLRLLAFDDDRIHPRHGLHSEPGALLDEKIKVGEYATRPDTVSIPN